MAVAPDAVVVSGIQPSGTLHIGNYFGAMRQHVALSKTAREAYFFIVNFHALTSLRDAEALRRYTYEVALDYLALGFDSQKRADGSPGAALFVQSDVPEVTELAWILLCLTPVADLENGLAYKDKVQNGLVSNAGLFTYPILQAADILAYRGAVVPVGADQRQNLEISRDAAARFNRTYCPHDAPVLPIPDALILPEVAVVPGTDGRKMSKSYGNTIGIFDEGAALKAKVMSIVTDSTPLEAPKDPDADHVYALLRLVAPPERLAEIADAYRAGGYGYGHAKKELLAMLTAHFAGARERRRELAARPDDVYDVLADGARRARTAARATMDAVRAASGLAYR